MAVCDLGRSVACYQKLPGFRVIADFGANKTLTGGLALQTVGTYREWIGANAVSFGGNDAQLYFEEDDFDAFIHKLDSQDIAYVHPVKEHSWGQRAVRFYGPDATSSKWEKTSRRFAGAFSAAANRRLSTGSKGLLQNKNAGATGRTSYGKRNPGPF